MNDILIKFNGESFIKIEAITEKGVSYLKTHWKKRKIYFGNIKFVKRFNIKTFKNNNILWTIESNCCPNHDNYKTYY